MLTRYLSGLAVGLGLAATAAAQSVPNPSDTKLSAPQTVPPAASVCPPQPADCQVADCAPCPSDVNVCDLLCGPPGRVWVSGEWLYWVASGQPVPPLVTAAPPGTPRGVAGTLGGPGTAVLFGGRRVNDDWRSGFRLNAGAWLNDCQTFGVAGDFFFLDDSRDRFITGPGGTGTLARPFINSLTGGPDAQLVSFPGVLSGSAAVEAGSEFIGGGGSLVCNLCCGPCGRADLLLGYRYLNLRDELTVREDLVTTDGTRFLITDRFRTDNDFHGVPVGFSAERRYGGWFAAVRSTVALGVSRQATTIDGSTTIVAPDGSRSVFTGGLLTQPTNIGRHTESRFAVVPEVGVRVGTQLGNSLRVFAGYDFVYWSSVARAGDQIDLRVNPNQIAPPLPLSGPARPAFTPNPTDFWVQGVSVGAELRF